jgi:hypothetical protein
VRAREAPSVADARDALVAGAGGAPVAGAARSQAKAPWRSEFAF